MASASRRRTWAGPAAVGIELPYFDTARERADDGQGGTEPTGSAAMRSLSTIPAVASRERASEDHLAMSGICCERCKALKLVFNAYAGIDDIILEEERSAFVRHIVDDDPQDSNWAVIFDVIFCAMFCSRLPSFAKRRCSEGKGKYALHVSYILFVVILFAASVGTSALWRAAISVNCDENYMSDPFANYSGAAYHCPRVQHVLINSHNMSTKQEREVLFEAFGPDQIVSSIGEFQYKFGEWFAGNSTSADGINDFADIRFLAWRACTRSMLLMGVAVLNQSLYNVIFPLLVIYFNFETKWDEWMFPLVLASHGACEGEPSRVVLRRPRLMVQQTIVMFTFGVGGIIVLKDIIDMLTITNNPLGGMPGMWLVIVWFPFFPCALFASILVGLMICVHNVTVLGNMLREVKTEEGFERWAETLKVTIGALHNYSWAISPIVLCGIAFSTVEISVGVVRLAYIYIGVQATGMPASAMLSDPFTINAMVSALLQWPATLCASLFGFAFISARYRRLRLLMATLEIGKRGQSRVFMLADVLLEQNGAFTLFDYPLRPAVVISGLWVFAVQLVVAALALAAA